MSTEHSPSTSPGASEHGLEYGPTPPGAKHEYTDIDPAVGYKFGLWLAVSMLISLGIMWGTFVVFERQEKSANDQARKYPLAVDLARQPPAPNLQTQPFKDIFMLRQSEAEKLGSYGWVDKEGGVTRIPIERAMEVMLEKGFPARAAGGDALNVVTQDSSSGRTMAPR